jgi:hypothetical protein
MYGLPPSRSSTACDHAIGVDQQITRQVQRLRAIRSHVPLAKHSSLRMYDLSA